MIDLEQEIYTTWTPASKAWYESRGYVFTKYKDKLIVKAKDLSPGSEVLVDAICDYCGEHVQTQYCTYLSSTKNYTQKYCCKKCKGIKAHEKNYDPKLYYDRYIAACEEKGFEPLTKLQDFTGCNNTVLIRCPKHGTQEVRYYYVLNGIGCPGCSKEIYPAWNKKSQDEVMEIIKSKNAEWLNYGEYIDVETSNLQIRCPKCKEPYTTSLASFKCSTGQCKKCSSAELSEKLRLPIEEVIRRIESSGENKLLNPQDYISNSEVNLRITCPCGNEFITSLCNYERGKNKCDTCANSKSKGEVLLENILSELNIEYDAEHSFPECRDKNALPFDFYLPQYNSCIEFDGHGHFESIYGQESFEQTKKHDRIKNKYCKQNGINLLRIPYWEAGNSKAMISNFLRLTEHPIEIKYHKNPYEE